MGANGWLCAVCKKPEVNDKFECSNYVICLELDKYPFSGFYDKKEDAWYSADDATPRYPRDVVWWMPMIALPDF